MADKYNPQKKFMREKCTTFRIQLVNSTNADIIEKLNSVPNKTGYIKNLIREDIKNNNK